MLNKTPPTQLDPAGTIIPIVHDYPPLFPYYCPDLITATILPPITLKQLDQAISVSYKRDQNMKCIARVLHTSVWGIK